MFIVSHFSENKKNFASIIQWQFLQFLTILIDRKSGLFYFLSLHLFYYYPFYHLIIQHKNFTKTSLSPVLVRSKLTCLALQVLISVRVGLTSSTKILTLLPSLLCPPLWGPLDLKPRPNLQLTIVIFFNKVLSGQKRCLNTRNFHIKPRKTLQLFQPQQQLPEGKVNLKNLQCQAQSSATNVGKCVLIALKTRKITQYNATTAANGFINLVRTYLQASGKQSREKMKALPIAVKIAQDKKETIQT